MTTELDPEAIRDAWDRLPAELKASPQFVHPGLSELAGAPVILKVETLNPLGSFKGRGAWTAVDQLLRSGRLASAGRLVTTSTGNWGQAVAYTARARGLAATVVVPPGTNPNKVARMRRLGADVVEAPAPPELAAELARRDGAVELYDGQHPGAAMGAATIAMEVTNAVEAGALPAPRVAFAPVGDGALIGGVGSWLRHALPTATVVGVQSERAPATALSWRKGAVVRAPAATFAEGIAVEAPYPEAVARLRSAVDDMVLVGEDALPDAQAELLAHCGVTAEGAGAAAWAGLRATSPDGPALVVISGSNAGPDELDRLAGRARAQRQGG
jgi:threonine dehydratase